MDLSFYKSYIAEEIRDEGRNEGIAQGQAEAVLLVLEQRGIHVPDEARERITSCGDLETLSRWLRRAVNAPAAEDIFADC